MKGLSEAKTVSEPPLDIVPPFTCGGAFTHQPHANNARLTGAYTNRLMKHRVLFGNRPVIPSEHRCDALRQGRLTYLTLRRLAVCTKNEQRCESRNLG